MRFILIIFLNLCVLSYAQVLNTPLPIGKTFSHVTVKSKEGVYKCQKVKGKITGSGIFKYKNGTIYVGDFKEKSFNGLGMIITSSGDTISNCKNARYYVGRFRDGKKHGKGVCYDVNGVIIYFGIFENDMPKESYNISEYPIKYFSDLQTEEFYYIGEFEGDCPNGFGCLISPNGDFIISSFNDGKPEGTTVYVLEDGNWVTEHVKSGQVTPISSSKEYTQLATNAKSAFKAGLGIALGYFTRAVEIGTQMLNYTSPDLHSKNFSVSSENESALQSRGTQYSNDDSNSGKFDLSEQRNYNSDKSTYSRYDSQLSQYFAGNRKASLSEVKDWQSRMKDLRIKWEGKGKSFPHSSNEEKTR